MNVSRAFPGWFINKTDIHEEEEKVMTVVSIEDIPYDAMGDYSAFNFDFKRKEERQVTDPERDGDGADAI